MNTRQLFLRNLPKIDEVLKDKEISALDGDIPHDLIVEGIREVIEEERKKILNAPEDELNDMNRLSHTDMVKAIVRRAKDKNKPRLFGIVNATGTILHTNLGRAGLSANACEQVTDVAKSYCSLEYNVEEGRRGSRHDLIADLLCELTGAEAAMAVNNNASAVLLCLYALAENKEVVVSRGELVEIGGSFRIPEIMDLSGGTLHEVGTTNKTHLRDYKNAIDEELTGLLLKVHTSNYQIMGFTAEVALEDLVELGKEHDLPVAYDLGSGLMVDLSPYGISEPTVKEALSSGVDLVLFSGDKLLGGPQAGIVLGKKEYIDAMKSHPLARVVRLDKMTLAALEATFRIYRDPKKALEEIPILKMISISKEDLYDKADRLYHELAAACPDIKFSIVEEKSQIGGGSTPNQFLPTYAIACQWDCCSAQQIEKGLRYHKTPVIGRIANDQLLLDPRTIHEDEFEIIIDAFKQMELTVDE